MTIQCMRCGKSVDVKRKGARPKYCRDCAIVVHREQTAKSHRKLAQAKKATKANADLWAHAIKVMRQTGKSYRECQVEGLFYTTEVD